MNNVPQIFNDAFAAFNSRDLAKAENLFRQVVETDSCHVPALNLLVVVLMSMERFAEAEPFIIRATALDQNSDVSFYNFGLISKRLNKPQQARENFEKALSLNPSVAETWNNRGTIFNDLKLYELAVADFDEAISLDGLYAEAYANKGKSLTLLKRYDEALTAYNKGLSIKPDLENAWLGLGDVFTDGGRFDEALAAYDKALSIKPDLGLAWVGRGNVLWNMRRYDEAFGAYETALSIKPDLEGAWLGRGNVFWALKRYDEALDTYGKALSIKPDLESAWVGRGNVLWTLTAYAQALAAYDKAVSIKADLESAWLGRGNVLADLKRFDEALAAYDKALSIKPDLESAWIGRGNVFLDLKRYDKAFAAYDKALSIKPDLESAWHGRGTAFFAQNRDAEALKCFDKALDLKQDFVAAQWNKALLKLSLGEYDEGWTLYECRWKTRFTSPRNFSQPLWLNNFDLNGKTLLVHAEPGLGNTIQFSRYLDRLTNMDAKVIFEVQKPLAALFKSQGWSCDVISQGDDLPSFDLHCPLLSLPLALKTTVATIPSKVPYIKAPQNGQSDLFRQISDTRLKVGVAWSGNAKFAGGHDISRPIPLSALYSIMSEKCEWFRLQKDLLESDEEAFASLSSMRDYSGSFDSFADTANLIAGLDLVISIDTSIAHLAGAMGKPVWILLPFHSDFRWLRERTDSPWYPTARLYRQTKEGDWTTVLNSVSNDLKNLAV
jgi:tetratricopeptide (TPR) repeat protein